MSSSDDSHRSAERRAINEAMEQMHLAMSDYYQLRHQIAMQNENPERHPDFRHAFLQFHSAVMHTFSKLRADIKLELADEYWNTTEYEPLTVPDGDGDEIGGLQLIDGWYDMTIMAQRDEYQRHGGQVRRTDFDADLPHHTVLREVANILHEAAKRLGYGASPTKRTPRTEISKETVEEFEEWRQQVIDRMDPDEAEEYLRFLKTGKPQSGGTA